VSHWWQHHSQHQPSPEDTAQQQPCQGTHPLDEQHCRLQRCSARKLHDNAHEPCLVSATYHMLPIMERIDAANAMCPTPSLVPAPSSCAGTTVLVAKPSPAQTQQHQRHHVGLSCCCAPPGGPGLGKPAACQCCQWAVILCSKQTQASSFEQERHAHWVQFSSVLRSMCASFNAKARALYHTDLSYAGRKHCCGPLMASEGLSAAATAAATRYEANGRCNAQLCF